MHIKNVLNTHIVSVYTNREYIKNPYISVISSIHILLCLGLSFQPKTILQQPPHLLVSLFTRWV